ncbi:MAG TPA: acyl-CoA dehydrogenase family protein [Candidatus Thermoplasmatota archaeon]|nr:acyl-CoA dehydrogenase family protein [Candidatus Thermoplasmatota archaeon]
MAGDFSGIEFTEEEKMLRQMVREFAEKEVAPRAEHIDKTAEFPWENVNRMKELGLLGVPVPQEYGGAGLGRVGYCIVVEELGRACNSTANAFGAHASLCESPITYWGSDDLKSRYLPKLAKGELLGAFALTEPNAGSDAAALETTAVKEGRDWVLNGTKVFITNGSVADVVVVFAANDKKRGSHGGITAFLVDAKAAGFKAGKKDDKMGIRGSDTVPLFFENVHVPEENVIGKVGEGFKVAMSTLDSGRCGLGAGCMGAASRCLELGLEYAKTRQQFGQPIVMFEAIQFMLAEMAEMVYTGRLLAYQVARRMDKGERVTMESAIVKTYCSEAGMKCADLAVQIHGGTGFMAEYPVQRLYRDARVTKIYEGTNEIQRLIIARELLKRFP